MKRAFTNLILAYWLVFFAGHAIGALTGSVNFQGLFVAYAPSYGGNELLQGFPILNAGLGNASLVAAVMFLWAMLTGIAGNHEEEADGEVDKLAFAGGALVFLALTAIAIIQARPELFAASNSYFAAIVLSWTATRLESGFHVAGKVSQSDADRSLAFARSMAQAASHPHRLAFLAKRDRT